jgi:hypothetical protein
MISVKSQGFFGQFTLIALCALLAFLPAKAWSQGKINEKTLAQGMTDAPAVIAQSKVKCDLIKAFFIADGNVKINGKNVKGKIYEVACKDGPGFILSTSPEGSDTPYTCTAADGFAERAKTFPRCTLPENLPHYAWLKSVAKSNLPGCEVTKARLLGSFVTNEQIDRYEVACADKRGGLFDVGLNGGKPNLIYRSCLMTEGTQSACQFQAKEDMISQAKTIGLKADASCQVNNVRFIGVTGDNDGYFYEFGCANKPGFVAIESISGTIDEVRSCALARDLGGCQFTSLADASATELTRYNKVLKDNGISCTVTEFNLVGIQASSRREFVEFKCIEQPWGLVGLIPQEGSTSSLNLSDCFIDASRRSSCIFVSKDAMKAQIQKLMKEAKSDTVGLSYAAMNICEVREVRYIGESSNEAEFLIAEVACTNNKGFIVEVNAKRDRIMISKSCRRPIEGFTCEISGNGAADDA